MACGTSDTPMGRKQWQLGLDRLPLANGGRTVEVYRTGRPYLTGRADQDPEELRGLTEGLGIKSRLSVALFVNQERRGTIDVCSAIPDVFSEADLRFLGAASRWTGALLHRFELSASMQKQAVEEGRRKAAEELFAVLAHDLRNVLASAGLRLALLSGRARQDERKLDLRDAGMLDASLRRLAQMTNNLLDVSRLERGVFSLDLRLVDVAAIGRQVASNLRRDGVKIEEHLPESLITMADPDRLSQALENLISNAIKHSPPDGTVLVKLEVAAEADKPRCVFSVVDQGPGVPAEILPRIFERYVSGEGSGDLGLDLYVARGVAVAHAGTLEVRSTASGATFELSLPIHD